MRVTRSSLSRALFRQIGAGCFNRFTKLHQIRCRFACLRGVRPRAFGLGQFRANAFQLRGKRGEAVFHLRRAVQQRRLTLTRFTQRQFSTTPRLTRIGLSVARLGFCAGGGLFCLAQQHDIRARGVKCLGLGPCGIGFGAVFGKAGQLRFKRCDAAFGARVSRGQFTLSTARGGCCDFSGATGIARGSFGAGGFRLRSLGGDARGFRLRCCDFSLIQPRFSRAQRIALRKPHSTRCGCAGVMRMAIPAPDSAFFRHQSLTRAQPRLQRGTIHAAREQTHLRKRTRQSRRRFHQARQRHRAIRQSLRDSKRRQAAPMPRGRGIRWAFQSLTQSSAKGRFQAGRHPHLIKNGLGGFCAARFQHFCQRRNFSRDARTCGTCFGGIAARLHQGFRCCGACRFGFRQPRRAANQRGFCGACGRMRGIARDFRNAFSKRGITFRRKGRILRDNAPVAVISGLQRGFAARGFGAGFLGGTARFGVFGDGFGTRCFRLFQSFTRRCETCLCFGNMLHSGLLFRVRHRARLGGVTIRT